MIWRSIQYDCPDAGLLLFFTLLLAWAFWGLYRFREERLGSLAEMLILDIILLRRVPLIFWIKAALGCLAWTLGVIALMQPKGNERYVAAQQGGQVNEAMKLPPHQAVLRKKMQEVIFLLDVSSSMSVADVHAGETRENVAKQIVDSLISQLNGENVSLYAFTSGTIQIVPSTTDYLFTRLMLSQVHINEGGMEGTDIRQALEDIHQHDLQNSAYPKTLVILTDGGDTHYESPEGEAKEQALEAIAKPLEDVHEQHVQVFVVGIGSKKGGTVPNVNYKGQPVVSTLNETLLHRLVAVSQGDLLLVEEKSPLNIVQTIDEGIQRQSSYEDTTTLQSTSQAGSNQRLYDFYFQIPLGAAIIALILFLLIPDTRQKQIAKGSL